MWSLHSRRGRALGYCYDEGRELDNALLACHGLAGDGAGRLLRHVSVHAAKQTADGGVLVDVVGVDLPDDAERVLLVDLLGHGGDILLRRYGTYKTQQNGQTTYVLAVLCCVGLCMFGITCSGLPCGPACPS